MKLQIALLAFFFRVAAGSTVSNPPDLSRLQQILDQQAVQYNTTLSLGLFHKNFGAFGVASGFADRKAKVPCTKYHKFPVGSVTKPFTVTAIMEFREKGLIDIDAPISKYVDPILARLNGTSMLKLWGGNSTYLNNVTARLLAGMRAGIHDYNDTWYNYVTLEQGDVDVTPFDLLHRLNKTFVCEPNACGLYASTGYELLGLALAELSGVSSWEDYNQMDVFGQHRHEFNNTNFHGRGSCADDSMIVHQYVRDKWRSNTSKPDANNTVIVNSTIIDLYNHSCLNGWTCGNIAVAPIDAARFHWSLHHGLFISNESLGDMMDFTRGTTQGWEPQPYGLGLMQSFPGPNCDWTADPTNETFTVGHAGADYGSLGHLSGYNLKHQFGIAYFSGSQSALNCSNYTGRPFGYRDMCEIYDEVIAIVSNHSAPRLNCSACSDAACKCLPRPNPGCTKVLEQNCPYNQTEPGSCYACAFNKTAPFYPDIHSRHGPNYCSPYQVEKWCGYPNQDCTPVFDKLCKHTLAEPYKCYSCLYRSNITNRKILSKKGCTAVTAEAYCGYPASNATCHNILDPLCGHARQSPGICLECMQNASHVKQIQNAGCYNAQQEANFCHYPAPDDQCFPVLNATCGQTVGSADPYQCPYCTNWNKTTQKVIAKVGCSPLQKDTFCGPSPMCTPLLEKLCGNITSKAICEYCTLGETKKFTHHRINITKAGCTATQKYGFCNITYPPKPRPNKHAAHTYVQNCKWDF